MRLMDRLLASGWRRAIGEVLLIVIGVTAALAVDEWRQNRNDKHLESEYKLRLSRDFEFDIENWRYVQDYAEVKISALDAALVWLQNPSESVDSARQYLDNLTAGTRLAYGAGLAAEDTTFKELVSTGRLGIIQDPNIRRALLQYYRLVEMERIRVTSRTTEFAPTIYKLIPRAPEFEVRDDLTDDQVLQIVQRSKAYDLVGMITAERNRARLRATIASTNRGVAADVLELIKGVKVDGK